MRAAEIATEAKSQIKQAPWEDNEDPKQETRGVYLGTVFVLDPCGSYHPPGDRLLSHRCERFWRALESELEKRGLALESGAGDPCDQFATEHRFRENLTDLALERGNQEIVTWLQRERKRRLEAVKRLRVETRERGHVPGSRLARSLDRAEVQLRNIESEIRMLTQGAA